jgi:c-di-AMP phosphodiesterase-like protein
MFVSVSRPDLAVFIIPATVVVFVVSVIAYLYSTGKNRNYLLLAAETMKRTEKSGVYSVPLAMTVIDAKQNIIWFNSQFKDSFEEFAKYGEDINKIGNIPIKELAEARTDTLTAYNGRVYSVSANGNYEDTAAMYSVFFLDVTARISAVNELELSKPVVMIAQIDGYDENFSEIPDSDVANITIKLDRLLENFTTETNGIMRKYGKDKTIFIIEKRFVDKLASSKVQLLDAAREIKVNDRVGLTLSIGIGTTGETLAESEQYAKKALEMAMGRGGDQAAVKTIEGFEFFGGISKPVERRNKTRVRYIANSLKMLIDGADRIFITGHCNSDLDSLGSSAALSAVIRNCGKEVYTIADAQTSLGQDLIDRLENDWENYNRVNGTPKKHNFFSTVANAYAHITPNSLLIICDTQNVKMLEDPELIFKFKNVAVIDHHLKMVNHIAETILFYHEPTASSASEMVTELIQYFDKNNRLSPVQAEAALAGIMLDTKNFTSKTGVRTFEAAAFLRGQGADTGEVRKLFAASFDNYVKKFDLISETKIYNGCAVTATDKYDDDYKTIAPQTADELINIRDIDASFVIFRTTEDLVAICARSYGKINVQVLMEKLGGGGHQTMAGTQLKGTSAINALPLLISALDDYQEENS